MEEEKKKLPKKRWFGRGIYGSKDVPIRILDGGIWSEADQEKMREGTAAGADSLEVTFGENYGVLPVPVKEGAVFGGWRYSGQNITEDTKVTVNGEHVLTAQWK